MLKKIIQIFAFILAIVVLFILSENFFFRLDLTSEKRYTLSDNTKNLLGGLDKGVGCEGLSGWRFEPRLFTVEKIG